MSNFQNLEKDEDLTQEEISTEKNITEDSPDKEEEEAEVSSVEETNSPTEEEEESPAEEEDDAEEDSPAEEEDDEEEDSPAEEEDADEEEDSPAEEEVEEEESPAEVEDADEEEDSPAEEEDDEEEESPAEEEADAEEESPAEEEDDESDDDENFNKLEQDVHKKYLAAFHPEIKNINYQELLALSRVVRDSTGKIIDELHKTSPFMTKYEQTRILGLRTKQINNNSEIFVSMEKKALDGYLIAKKELAEKAIPFIIKRPLPNGQCEYWKVEDLDIISF